MKLSLAPKLFVTCASARRPAITLVVLLAVLGLVFSAGGGRRLCAADRKDAASAEEQFSLGNVKNFVVPDYYDPPNQNQIKSLLRGAQAQPQPNGRVLVKELRLETYGTNGRAVMIVRAPDCTYDQAAQTATSANHIEARSGDSKLSIEGMGFRWDQANSTFVISNEVRTMIRQSPDTISVP